MKLRYIVAVLPLQALVSALAASRSVKDGVYTKQQAARGQSIYDEECARCHGQTLGGGEGSPELVGADFLGRWKGRTVGELFKVMRETMPTDDPGHLSTRQYADLAGFILSSSGLPSGQRELENDVEALNEIRFEAK